MGEARHHPVRPRLGLREQSALQRQEPFVHRVAPVAHPEPEVGRHLVVAAPRGVEALGGLADQLGQARLHVHVDVLQRRGEGEALVLDL